MFPRIGVIWAVWVWVAQSGSGWAAGSFSRISHSLFHSGPSLLLCHVSMWKTSSAWFKERTETSPRGLLQTELQQIKKPAFKFAWESSSTFGSPLRQGLPFCSVKQPLVQATLHNYFYKVSNYTKNVFLFMFTTLRNKPWNPKPFAFKFHDLLVVLPAMWSQLLIYTLV